MRSRSRAKGAVADDARCRPKPRSLRSVVTRPVAKRLDHYRALALGERLQAPGELVRVEAQEAQAPRPPRRYCRRSEQRLAAPGAAPDFQHHHATHARDERGDPLRLAQLPRSQPLERHEEHLLHEVVRRMRIAQVAEAVESHAWRKSPIKLCFGRRIKCRAGRSNAPREGGVLECFGVFRHAGNSTVICWDV
jgi:hypothetical protein